MTSINWSENFQQALSAWTEFQTTESGDIQVLFESIFLNLLDLSKSCKTRSSTIFSITLVLMTFSSKFCFKYFFLGIKVWRLQRESGRNETQIQWRNLQQNVTQDSTNGRRHKQGKFKNMISHSSKLKTQQTVFLYTLIKNIF